MGARHRDRRPGRGARRSPPRREALEETGVDISVDRLASVGVSPQVTHANGDLGVYLDLTFACTWLGGEAHVADDENVDVRWWPLDALPAMAPFRLERIEAASPTRSRHGSRADPTRLQVGRVRLALGGT